MIRNPGDLANLVVALDISSRRIFMEHWRSLQATIVARRSLQATIVAIVENIAALSVFELRRI
jgi:hypothetical protein